jgi:SAM-dependent methyltransferase
MNSGSRSIGYRERAELYELEYTTTADHDFLIALTAPPVRSVLEIPCGVGRNALHLARPGLRLVAVDIEPEMINVLRRRTLGESRSATVEAVVGDLRSLSLGETFERIIVPREAFQLLTDLGDAHDALVHLRDHLDAEGIMVVDLAHFRTGTDTEPGLQPAYFDPSRPEGEVLVEWEYDLPSGAHVTRSRQQFVPSARRRLVRYHYDVRWPDGRHEDWTMDVPLLVYEHDDFLELAHRAGLEARHVYRDYQRRPHAPGAARMIFLLHRTGSSSRA